MTNSFYFKRFSEIIVQPDWTTMNEKVGPPRNRIIYMLFIGFRVYYAIRIGIYRQYRRYKPCVAQCFRWNRISMAIKSGENERKVLWRFLVECYWGLCSNFMFQFLWYKIISDAILLNIVHNFSSKHPNKL